MDVAAWTATFAPIASHPWLYPALEVLHIVGIALLLGNLAAVELRLWGLGAALPLPALARLGLGLVGAGFVLAAGSGTLMALSQLGDLLANPALRLKLVLIVLAGLNALAFHLRHGLVRQDALARAQTLASLGLWLAVIVCGRWIAYV